MVNVIELNDGYSEILGILPIPEGTKLEKSACTCT